LEGTHRHKNETNRLKNKKEQLVDRKKLSSIHRKQITHLLLLLLLLLSLALQPSAGYGLIVHEVS
jgi:hypothetical protein